MGEGNSVQLTEEQLVQIEDMASNLITAGEIAILMALDVEMVKYIVKNKKDHQIYQAYHKGRLKTKLALHKMVIKLAERGSPQAEMLADKYLRDQNSDNL